MFHCSLHEPVSHENRAALNGRLKCHVTRLTFITGFLEWEWRWVLMAQKCHSYTVCPRTVGFPVARGNMAWERRRLLHWMEPINTEIASQPLLRLSAPSAYEGQNGETSDLYLYMHDSLFCVCVCVCVCVVYQLFTGLFLQTQLKDAKVNYSDYIVNNIDNFPKH